MRPCKGHATFPPVILCEMGISSSLAFAITRFFKIALHLLFRQDFGSGQIPVKVDGSEFASEQQVFGVCRGMDREQLPR